MRASLIYLCLLGSALVARAGELPPKAAFEAYSVAQMRRLPDYRVPLCTPIDLNSLRGRSQLELGLLKNSIFAQVGYRFQTPSYRNYFLSRPWYREEAVFDATRLCPVDHENVKVIAAMTTTAKPKAPRRPVDAYPPMYGDF